MATTSTQIMSTDYITALTNLGYSFRINMCNDRLEVNEKPITDNLESQIFTELRDAKLPNVRVARDAYIMHALKNRYHPVRDYLNSLKYDGGKYISQLVNYFDNPDDYLKLWLPRFFIGAVRRVMQPGTQNRMLVLDGPQGKGKSCFVEWLVPEHLRTEHFKEGPINPEIKDDRIALMTTWIWEVADLGSTTRKADREALKSFLSMKWVTERVVYARNPIQKPALTSFIGTLNSEGGVLSDPTGSRRFMFCRVMDVNWHGYTSELTPDQIWSEAYSLYLMGEPADLTPQEELKADGINAQFEVENPLEGIIAKWYDINPNEIWWTSTEEILRTILHPDMGAYKSTTDMASKRLASLMTALGCKRKRDRLTLTGNPVMGYTGVRKNADAIRKTKILWPPSPPPP